MEDSHLGRPVGGRTTPRQVRSARIALFVLVAGDAAILAALVLGEQTEWDDAWVLPLVLAGSVAPAGVPLLLRGKPRAFRAASVIAGILLLVPAVPFSFWGVGLPWLAAAVFLLRAGLIDRGPRASGASVQTRRST